MKKPHFLLALSLPFLFGIANANAAILEVDLSPAGGSALNLGVNPYNGDHAIGLSGLNEPGQFNPSGSGNEVGAGISYDDVSNQLSFDMAYGSVFGFDDLLGDLTVLHVHGPGFVNFPAPNTNGGVQFSLAGFLTPSGTMSGRITGVEILTAAQEQLLIDNSLYVNIHSTFATGGEIRGQLILVPEPSTVALAAFGLVGVMCVTRRRACCLRP